MHMNKKVASLKTLIESRRSAISKPVDEVVELAKPVDEVVELATVEPPVLGESTAEPTSIEPAAEDVHTDDSATAQGKRRRKKKEA